MKPKLSNNENCPYCEEDVHWRCSHVTCLQSRSSPRYGDGTGGDPSSDGYRPNSGHSQPLCTFLYSMTSLTCIVRFTWLANYRNVCWNPARTLSQARSEFEQGQQDFLPNIIDEHTWRVLFSLAAWEHKSSTQGASGAAQGLGLSTRHLHYKFSTTESQWLLDRLQKQPQQMHVLLFPSLPREQRQVLGSNGRCGGLTCPLVFRGRERKLDIDFPDVWGSFGCLHNLDVRDIYLQLGFVFSL